MGDIVVTRAMRGQSSATCRNETPRLFERKAVREQAEAWAGDVTARQEAFTPPMQVDPVTASFPAFFQPVFNDDRVAATVFGD